MLFISWNSWGQRYGSACERVCVLRVWWPQFDSQNPWGGRIDSLMLSSDLSTYVSWTLTFLALYQHLTEPFRSWSLFRACWGHPVKRVVFAARILFFNYYSFIRCIPTQKLPLLLLPPVSLLPPHISLDLPSLYLPSEKAGFPGISAKRGIICGCKTRHVL